MQVKIVKEAGYEEALLGMALSFYKESENVEEFWDQSKYERMTKVARNLSAKGPSHSKFIRQCQIWVLVKAPRFFWSEFDTYKVGTTGLSASTMHTLKKEKLTQDHFEYPILGTYLEYLNREIEKGASIESLKNDLPEGYLQTRLVSMNYQVLRTIIAQRASHRLPQWTTLIASTMAKVEHPELLQSIIEE
jgi:hypothetical protein